MRKIIFMGISFCMAIIMAGCKSENEETTDIAHKEHLDGKVIEVRDDNEILLEITEEQSGYKKGDTVLIGYTEYTWSNPEDTGGKKYNATPKINDLVVVGYWKYEVEKKEGYDYIPNQNVEKFQRNLFGKVLEVRDDNEIVIEVTKKQEEYSIGDKILVSYKEYYWIDTDDINVTKSEKVPVYNDSVEFGYWQENVSEKDGYVYMSDIYVREIFGNSPSLS